MEIPNYRFSSAKSVWQLIVEKAKGFAKKVFTIIFVASLIIWFLQTFDIRLNVAASAEESLLALLGGDVSLLGTLFTPFIAFVFLVFTLLYTRCVAAVATVKREMGRAKAAAGTMELHNRGYQANHKTVQGLMKTLHLKCMARVKRYRSYKGEVGTVAPNILKRDFNTTAPNQKWTTDITGFALSGTKLYLSLVLDMYNREIISHEISDKPALGQALRMPDNVFTKVSDNTNLIFHSGQGWQYQHKADRKRLKDKGIRQSMSRKGLSPVQYRLQSLSVA